MTSSHKNRYRPEIDGLRALAVVSVLFYHVDETWIPNGFLGVDVFFVISGFVITRSIVVRTDGTLGDFLASFYARRIKRLLPALAFCVVLTSLAAWYVNPEPEVSFVTGALSLFGLSNIFLYTQALDYFAAPSQLNHFTHTWSLGVEEQFYLLYPLCLWGVARMVATKSVKAGPLVVAIGALSIASLAGYIWFQRTDPMAAFFLMPMRFWELGSGCLLALTAPNFRQGRKAGIMLNPVWPLIALSVTMFAELDTSWHTAAVTISAVAASLWLIAVIEGRSLTRAFFDSAPVVYIGRISYSLYLWHWSVLTVAAWRVEFTLVNLVFIVATMFALAIISYHLVETPLRRASWSSRKLLTIGYGFAAAGLCCVGLATFAKMPALSNTRLTQTDWSDLTIVHKRLTCHLPTASNPFQRCLTRSAEAENTIFVVGDSHASNLVPSLEAATANSAYAVRYLGDRTMDERTLGAWADYLGGQVQPGDKVIFSIWRNRIYDSDAFRGQSRAGEQSSVFLAVLQAGLANLRDSVSASGGDLVIVDDVPYLCTPSEFEILHANGRLHACQIKRQISLDDRQPLTDLYLGQVAPDHYLDPHDPLCGRNVCSAIVDGQPLYGDGASHFSNYSPAPLHGFFSAWLGTDEGAAEEDLLAVKLDCDATARTPKLQFDFMVSVTGDAVSFERGIDGESGFEAWTGQVSEDGKLTVVGRYITGPGGYKPLSYEAQREPDGRYIGGGMRGGRHCRLVGRPL